VPKAEAAPGAPADALDMVRLTDHAPAPTGPTVRAGQRQRVALARRTGRAVRRVLASRRAPRRTRSQRLREQNAGGVEGHSSARSASPSSSSPHVQGRGADRCGDRLAVFKPRPHSEQVGKATRTSTNTRRTDFVAELSSEPRNVLDGRGAARVARRPAGALFAVRPERDSRVGGAAGRRRRGRAPAVSTPPLAEVIFRGDPPRRVAAVARTRPSTLTAEPCSNKCRPAARDDLGHGAAITLSWPGETPFTDPVQTENHEEAPHEIHKRIRLRFWP